MMLRITRSVQRYINPVVRSLHIFQVDKTRSNVTSYYGINLKDTQQSSYALDHDALLESLDEIRTQLGYSDYGIDVWICGDEMMSRYNSLWRGPKKKKLDTDQASQQQQLIDTQDGSTRRRGRSRKPRVGSRKSGVMKKGASNSTDILSFPAQEFYSPGVLHRPIGGVGHPQHLGDLMVSPAYIDRQCQKDRQMDEDGYEYEFEEGEVGVFRTMSSLFTVQERLPLLFVHGCVHLLGYDHETPEEWAAMTAKEEEVLSQLKWLRN